LQFSLPKSVLYGIVKIGEVYKLWENEDEIYYILGGNFNKYLKVFKSISQK
jgi:hypothetical protein